MIKREVVRESTKKENDRHGRVTTGKAIEKEERQKGKENILRDKKGNIHKKIERGNGNKGEGKA